MADVDTCLEVRRDFCCGLVCQEGQYDAATEAAVSALRSSAHVLVSLFIDSGGF